MIKFFRNIRQNLLRKNRFSGYLFYAIGEIVLVVIGILIALQINNNNERRKNEEKVTTILKQELKELEANIESSDQILKFYMQKDSLIYLVLNQKVTAADYVAESGFYFKNLVGTLNGLITQRNAFDNLSSLSDYIPEPLDSISLDLKTIYIDDLEQVKSIQELLSDGVYNHLNWLKMNTSWFKSSYHRNAPTSQEELDFYLKSDYYQNEVYSYWIMAIANYYISISRFRSDAYECYKKLTKKLDLKEEIARNPPSFYFDPETYKEAMGTYRDSTKTYKIFSKNNELVVQQDDYPPITLNPINQSQFIGTPGAWILNLIYDDQHQVTGLTDSFGDNIIELKKIE